MLWLGGAYLASQTYSEKVFWEEKVETAEPEPEPTYEELTEDFQTLNNTNFDTVFKNTENKFIFMVWPSKASTGHLKTVANHANKMKAGLQAVPYIVDMEKDGEEFLAFLKRRDMRKELEQQIEENCFVLVNRYDDVWFWDENLIAYFQGELMEQVFNFYQGVRILHDTHELMITMTPNDNHFVTFWNELNTDNNKKLKNMRRFQTKNTDSFLKIKFWIIKNKDLATKLGIDTEAELGDLYMLKGILLSLIILFFHF